MNTLPRKTCLGLLLAAGLAAAGVVSADDKMPAASMAGHSDGSMQLHQIMMDGQKMPMTMTGNIDKDFATMMTMHHRQALKVADVMIQHGSNAKLKKMAEKMKTAQTEEIKELAPHRK